MASLNSVQLIGRLGRDPEVKYTQSQTAVTSLAIATSEYRKDQTGQTTETTEWHRVTVWARAAEACGQYLRKGSQVFVEGRLTTRKYDKDGQTHYATEIVASNVQFLDSKPQEQSQGQEQGFDAAKYSTPMPGPNNHTTPQNAHRAPQNQSGYQMSNNDPISIDNIPF